MTCPNDCTSCCEGARCSGCPHDHDKELCLQERVQREIEAITYHEAQERGL